MKEKLARPGEGPLNWSLLRPRLRSGGLIADDFLLGGVAQFQKEEIAAGPIVQFEHKPILAEARIARGDFVDDFPNGARALVGLYPAKVKDFPMTFGGNHA